MNYKRLIICLALPQLAGLAGSFFTSPAISGWYANLIKPGFNPPNWIFGPVWFSLYLMMGVGVYLVWQKMEALRQAQGVKTDQGIKEDQGVKGARGAKWAMRLFWIHLVFNASWSIIFFGLKNPGLALINIVIIWLFIVVLMFKFRKISKWAFYLLIPYFVWVSFAALLNYSIWVLN